MCLDFEPRHRNDERLASKPMRNMIENPKFSVILPYLRAESTIRRAMDSVLCQTFDNFEVITIGDGSTDGTFEILAAYAGKDNRVRNISYGENCGPSFARNRGIEIAQGEWIALLDADDSYHPKRLENISSQIRLSPIIVDNMMAVDPYNAEEVGVMFQSFPSILTIEDIVAPMVEGSNFDYGYLKPTFLRSFLIENRLKYDEQLRTAEDFVFLVECCLKAKCVDICEEPFYLYNLQVSPKYPRKKGTTHTVPRNKEVASVLTDLLDRHREELGENEKNSLYERIQGLLKNADVNEFRHNLLYGSSFQAIKIFFFSHQARNYLARTLTRKLVKLFGISRK